MMQKFQKKPNTGMHKTVFRAGSVINGVKMEKAGAMVVRPGNTIICVAEDLGVSGLAQFALLSPPIPAEPEAPQAGIIIVLRSPGYYNVVNSNNVDKPLNEKALRKADAEAMVESLLNPGEIDVTAIGETADTDPDATETDAGEDYEAYEWDALVGFLTDREVEIEDSWESDGDLRKALIDLDNKG